MSNEGNENITKENVIYVFIDASNLWSAQKSKGRFLDFEKTINYIKGRFEVAAIKAFYYTAYPGQGTRNYSLDAKHKFFTYLKKALGFTVIKKELKRISVTNGGGEVIEEKGNMDVEMTIDVMLHFKKYKTAIFFSGDSDFLALVTYLKIMGKKYLYFLQKITFLMNYGLAGMDTRTD